MLMTLFRFHLQPIQWLHSKIANAGFFAYFFYLCHKWETKRPPLWFYRKANKLGARFTTSAFCYQDSSWRRMVSQTWLHRGLRETRTREPHLWIRDQVLFSKEQGGSKSRPSQTSAPNQCVVFGSCLHCDVIQVGQFRMDYVWEGDRYYRYPYKTRQKGKTSRPLTLIIISKYSLSFKQLYFPINIEWLPLIVFYFPTQNLLSDAESNICKYKTLIYSGITLF